MRWPSRVALAAAGAFEPQGHLADPGEDSDACRPVQRMLATIRVHEWALRLVTRCGLRHEDLAKHVRGTLVEFHHRQPSIIREVDIEEWLAPGTPQDRLLALARHSTEGPFDCWLVSKRVNYPRNDAPDLLAPLAA